MDSDAPKGACSSDFLLMFGKRLRCIFVSFAFQQIVCDQLTALSYAIHYGGSGHHGVCRKGTHRRAYGIDRCDKSENWNENII